MERRTIGVVVSLVMSVVLALAGCGGASSRLHASRGGSVCATPLADAMARLRAGGIDPNDTGYADEEEQDTSSDAPQEDGRGLDTTSYAPPDDLDGDGRPETFVELLMVRGVHNSSFMVYLSGGVCPHYAGTIEGDDSFLTTAHHGVRDISYAANDGCLGLEGHGGVYEYDGTSYVDNRAHYYTCSCPADAPDAVRDARCPTPEP